MQIHILDSKKGSLFLSNGAHIPIPDDIVNTAHQKITSDIRAWALQHGLINDADTVAFSI